MSDPSPLPPLEFPPVEPSNFDLIVIGTGLPESIIAAAASTAGKSVLHLDPNPFYGCHFSSLSPPDLSSFLLSPPSLSSPSPSDEYDPVPLSTKSLFTSIEISQNHLENSRNFFLDVSGPRVLFCAGSTIDLMLRSGVNRYMEFKSVDSSLIYDGEKGNLASVPDSRSAIFKDRSLKLTEKNQMMRFLKLVQEHLEGMERGEREGVISNDDLESSFLEFLTKMKLPDKIKSIVLFAIAMADYDQGNVETCKNLLKTKDGIDRLALYHLSIARFPNAQGAMLYPMYGQGELPQAFCRRAAVKGCINVLRMPVVALLAEKGSGLYKGVKLASGQDLFSSKLVMGPQFTVPQGSVLSWSNTFEGISKNPSPNIRRKVARGICISKSSMKLDTSNLLLVFPPKSLYPEQATSVRALQLGGGAAVCPVGMFVLYLSALCDDDIQGKKLLTGAINALFRQPMSETCEMGSIENPEDTSASQNASAVERIPTLMWSALYIQETTEGSVDIISSCPNPDEKLSYNDLIDVTKKMFSQIYPDEEFFPEKASSEDHDGDGDGVDSE